MQQIVDRRIFKGIVSFFCKKLVMHPSQEKCRTVQTLRHYPFPQQNIIHQCTLQLNDMMLGLLVALRLFKAYGASSFTRNH